MRRRAPGRIFEFGIALPDDLPIFVRAVPDLIALQYPFAAWRDLRVPGTWIPTDCAHPDVYPCAATDGENAAVLLTDCCDRDDAPGKDADGL